MALRDANKIIIDDTGFEEGDVLTIAGQNQCGNIILKSQDPAAGSCPPAWCTIEDVTIDGGTLNDVTIDGGTLNDVTINDAIINDAIINDAIINDSTLNNTTLTGNTTIGACSPETTTIIRGDVDFQCWDIDFTWTNVTGLPSWYTLPAATATILWGIKVGSWLSVLPDGTLSATWGSWYTDEQAQDAVGTILVDTNTINLTYNDTTPSITADVIIANLISSDAGNDLVAWTDGKLFVNDTTWGSIVANQVYGTSYLGMTTAIAWGNTGISVTKTVVTGWQYTISSTRLWPIDWGYGLKINGIDINFLDGTVGWPFQSNSAGSSFNRILNTGDTLEFYFPSGFFVEQIAWNVRYNIDFSDTTKII